MTELQSEFAKNIKMMLEEIEDLNIKQIYIYLKSGVTLFMGGKEFEIKTVRSGILVSGLRETSVISWGSIAGVKVLKEINTKEAEETDDDNIEDSDIKIDAEERMENYESAEENVDLEEMSVNEEK